MHRALFVLALVAPLAACGEPSAPETPAPDPAPAPAPVDPTPAAAAPAPGEPPARPRYVGRWAANEGLCAGGAWTFRREGLSTAGEVSCDFEGVAVVDDGYEIAAACVAQAPPEQARIHLAFGPGDRTMTVTGGPFASPPPLIRCGD